MKPHSPKTFVALLGFLLLPLTAAQAETYSWNKTNAGPHNWTDSTIWNPSSGNPGDDGVNDTALLNRLPSATATYDLVLDADRTIGLLGMAYNPTTTEPTTFTLTGTKSLTVGSAETPGNIYIVSQTSSNATSGSFNIGDHVTISLIGGEFKIATPSSHNASGTVQLQSADATLNVGTATHRSNWIIADRAGNSSKYNATGTFNATEDGGNLNAYLTGLSIATYSASAGNNVKDAKSKGTMDLTNLTSAQIDTDTLAVAVSSSGSTTGTFHIGSHKLTVNNAVEIGTGGSATGTPSGADQDENIVIGTVTMDAGSTVSFGTAGNRATLVLGTNGTSRVAPDGKVERTGSFTANGGEFSAHLDSLTIGVQNATAAGKYYKAEGILDLRNATQVSAFDVAGDVILGNGIGEGSMGSLYLPEIEARIGGNLVVGDDKVGGGLQAASLGLVDLTGTQLTVEGDVAINLTGGIRVEVNGNSAGLWLTDEAAAFTIDSVGGYFIDFESASLGQYGFAWEGDHLATLGSLIDNGNINWSGESIDLFYESGVTYIGVVPEPRVAGLLMGAALFVLLRGFVRARR